MGVEKPDSGRRWMDGRTNGRSRTAGNRPRAIRRDQEDQKKEAMKAEKFWSTRVRKTREAVSLSAKYVIQLEHDGDRYRRQVLSAVRCSFTQLPPRLLIAHVFHRPSLNINVKQHTNDHKSSSEKSGCDRCPRASDDPMASLAHGNENEVSVLSLAVFISSHSNHS